jgi:hypothetical protein
MPGIEQHFVDRAVAGGKLSDQRIQRNIVDHDRVET